MEGTFPREDLDCQKQLQITLSFSSFDCTWLLWKHHCNVTFCKVPNPLSLGDLQKFTQGLVPPLQIHQCASYCDVESLPIGGGSYDGLFSFCRHGIS
jgi:hypothetical protein